MSKKRVSIEARLDDYVSKNADAVKSKLKGITDTASAQTRVIPQLSSAFKGLAASLGPAVVAYKALAFGKESIGLYETQAKATAKLEQVVRATGGAAGYTADQLKRMSSEMQDNTTYGDEVVQQAQAMLLTFKNISGDVFPRAMESIADMGEMFGSLDSSAVQLGKALNNPILGVSALSEVGIQFTEQQKQQIKKFTEVNDIASAQAVILKEIEGQFGGVARAMAQTDVGRLQQQKNVLSEIKEEIGKEIIPLQEGWNRLMLGLVSTIGIVLKSYGAIGQFLRGIAGGKSAKAAYYDTRMATALDQSARMDKEKAIKNLTDWRSEVDKELKSLEQSMAKSQNEQLNLQMIGNKKLAEKRGEELGKLRKDHYDLKQIQLTYNSEILKLETPAGAAASGGGGGGAVDENLIKKRREEIAKVEAMYAESSIALIRDKHTRELSALAFKQSEERKLYADNKKALALLDLTHVNEEYSLRNTHTEEKVAEEKKKSETMVQVRQMYAESELASIVDKYDREMALLVTQQEAERLAYKDNADALFLIDQVHQNRRNELDAQQSKERIANAKAEAKTKAAAAQEFASMFASTLVMIGQATKADAETQKRFSQLQAVINTAVAISKALATPYLIPLIAAQGAAQVAIINQQKFAQGGIVAGPRHPVDTVPIRASGREMMLNERQQRNLFNMISKGGGSGQGITLQLYGQQGDLVETLTAELRNGEARPLIDMITQMVGANV